MLPPELAGKIDDLMKADLQLWRDWCFHWLLISTAVVIIGVALEGPELVLGTISIIRRKFCRADPAEQHHLPDWVALLGLLGWFLIVLGVAGEYVTDAMVSKADGSIQTFNDILLRDAQKEAGYARTSAEEAANAAGRAEHESNNATTSASNALALATGARSEADSFEKDIVSAKKKAADAESHLADALQRAANAEREIARIKRPRELSLEQQERVGNALSKFARQNFAFLVFGDPESLALLANIDAALKFAKWNRVAAPSGLGGDIAYNTPGGSVPSINDVGLKIYVAADDAPAEPAAQTFAAALSAEGIPCEPHRSERLKGQTVKLLVITVGQKQL